jgi:glucose-1-phosphate adenylyltransferase
MKINESGRITDFTEKPKGDKLKAFEVDTTILGLDRERAAVSAFVS